MAVTVHIDAATGVRISTLSGTVTDAELLEVYQGVLDDPDYDPSLHDLVDTCGVVRVAATPDGIRRLAQLVARMDERYGATRVALVAPGGPAYVMAQLYTFYRDAQQSPLEHRVFRSLAEAREWLGIPKDGSGGGPAEER